MEALTFFTNQVLGGNLDVVEKNFVRLVIDHVADWPYRQSLPQTFTYIYQEER